MSLLILIVPPAPSLPTLFFINRLQLLILIFQAHGFFSPSLSHALQVEFVLINQSFPAFCIAQTLRTAVQAINVLPIISLGVFISSFLSSFIFFLGPGMGLDDKGFLCFSTVSSACSCSPSPNVPPSRKATSLDGQQEKGKTSVEGKTTAQLQHRWISGSTWQWMQNESKNNLS